MGWKMKPMILTPDTIIIENEMINQGAMDAELGIHGPFILWRDQ